jgi:UDP-GlcNAc3NAcA epimerase
MRRRVVTVVGARPQFIKAAAVSRVLRASPGLEEALVHTGQHYDENMSDVFFADLEIPAPDHHLGIGSGSHGAQTGRMLAALETLLLAEKPDCVLVYGDTNSTLAAALAASKLHIPVAHVEAGLRSFNRQMPEEINRVLTDHVSRWLFAPTETAVEHLLREGLPADRVHQVGDVMFDASLYYGTMAETRRGIMERLGLAPGGYVLATIHRAENTDVPERLRSIFEGLRLVGCDIPVLLPLHPRTRAALEQAGMLAENARSLRLIDPVGYLDMVLLEKHARLIATDSGGIQKEAYFHGVPCVTLRSETEWVELVQGGWNVLADPQGGAAAIAAALRGALEAHHRVHGPPLYGDGKAAQRIVAILNGETEGAKNACAV